VGSLIAAVREVGRSGDEAQRQAARAVIDNAVRAVWTILAQGPVLSPDAPAPAAGGDAEVEVEPATADGGEAVAATEA
jgi:hypothetical protein